VTATVAPARTSARLEALDGYRALAALCVVVTHVAFQTAAIRGPFGNVLARLDIGVTVFFLLSGFLLVRPWLRAHEDGGPGPRTGPYAWHRFLRIMPAYWVVVVVAMLANPVNRDSSLGEWLVQVLLLQIYVDGGLVPELTQMWSLATELSFYIVLPVLGWWLLRRRSEDPVRRRRRRWALVVVLLVLAQVWRAAAFLLPDVPAYVLYWLPNHIDWFALGFALAMLRLDDPRLDGRIAAALRDLARQPGVCWTIALSAFWVSTTSLAGPLDLLPPTMDQAFLKHLLYGVAAFFALLPAVVGPGTDRGTRGFASAPALWLGKVSYGIFLWNMFMVTVALRLTDTPVFTGRFWTILAVVLALTLAAAAASWYLVERPASRLRDRGPGRTRA
jgi:peptidoglycan/LPS O-acetylase OafA/YrhL